MRPERGAVLIVSSLLLLVLMVIALALTGASRNVIQAEVASAARSQVLQQLHGALDGFIERQRLARADSLLLTNSAEVSEVDAVFGAQHGVSFITEGPCQRQQAADAGSHFVCRINQVSSSKRYGKGERGQQSITTGVQQQVLVVGN
ncbi:MULTISPECIES: pilus assembly protein PilX [Ferrimonas]|uniref:pilus assembly protein PilX n=1 Tax=Ferrimonas TaxID=44011 RepID=UPI0012EB71AD|nr:MULTISPECIES: pilus assembly protein PilX [Ferrimonas]USD38217.1 pilus assembly protein PilX [Ferrimonas sp. SCSIO 43195]